MELNPGTFCPLLKEDCIQFKCAFWTHLRGKHPQTGQDIDEYDCAVKWLPVMVIEVAKETRQTAAAVESFRNRVVEHQIVMQRLSAKYESPVLDIKELPTKVNNGDGG